MRYFNYVILIITCLSFTLAYAQDQGFGQQEYNQMIQTGLKQDNNLFQLVEEKNYAKGKAEAIKGVDAEIEELDHIISMSMIPYNKRWIYLRRPYAYFEILAGINNNALASKMAQEIIKTMPETQTYDKLIDLARRANNAVLIRQLNTERSKARF